MFRPYLTLQRLYDLYLYILSFAYKKNKLRYAFYYYFKHFDCFNILLRGL
ncbi:hypothetical protein MCHI_001852 [Candidatus Magnetoovum chiemensis]|nr:hypothetical protein MCHI_001852 [Candidatus Magnetoovum chiemensis]